MCIVQTTFSNSQKPKLCLFHPLMQDKEYFSIIPGFDPSKKPSPLSETRKPRKRFVKAAVNADHPYTARLREIKTAMCLTTPQLVKELNDYERVHQSTNFNQRSSLIEPTWMMMNTVLLSSYLQGWVVRENYMVLMVHRLENLFKFKKSQGQVGIQADMRTIIEGWYKALGIDQTRPKSSPTRELANLIAPYYKRPVRAGMIGTFHLGVLINNPDTYTITDSEGITHEFPLNPDDPCLIKDGQEVKNPDVIQYSLLMQTVKKDGKVISLSEPSIDHTTFYRWYSNNKMPRSIETIELVQSAVDLAVKAMKITK